MPRARAARCGRGDRGVPPRGSVDDQATDAVWAPVRQGRPRARVARRLRPPTRRSVANAGGRPTSGASRGGAATRAGRAPSRSARVRPTAAPWVAPEPLTTAAAVGAATPTLGSGATDAPRARRRDAPGRSVSPPPPCERQPAAPAAAAPPASARRPPPTRRPRAGAPRRRCGACRGAAAAAAAAAAATTPPACAPPPRPPPP
ncbi:hypothetical protein BU14_0296s0010 [Porphyra umbilicalis]|uniref:Uncharacterized protein n=1 Tax=Porphyra umbilicalis TaxID=2786 RepID=A0A1X6P0I8_PORUM|nr:hypothetical protein BU14_0296s0010 [Porphyra umbilicalis]|eukprot:OSX74295.1 hypothetical protein BU14_0296s0010 [Porphyra umbilicalis]